VNVLVTEASMAVIGISLTPKTTASVFGVVAR